MPQLDPFAAAALQTLPSEIIAAVVVSPMPGLGDGPHDPNLAAVDLHDFNAFVRLAAADGWVCRLPAGRFVLPAFCHFRPEPGAFPAILWPLAADSGLVLRRLALVKVSNAYAFITPVSESPSTTPCLIYSQT